MTAGIRISIEQRIASPVTGNHIICFIITRLGDTGKEAFRQRWFGRQDILNPPGRVQRFHRPRVLIKLSNVKKRRKAKSVSSYRHGLSQKDGVKKMRTN